MTNTAKIGDALYTCKIVKTAQNKIRMTGGKNTPTAANPNSINGLASEAL